MALSKDDVLDALWAKHEALYDFLQEMNERHAPQDLPDVEPIMINGELEIARIQAVYDLIDRDRPIPFPSDEQVRALAQATGALEAVVRVNAEIDKMVQAAGSAIKTWPVSRGG